MIKFGTGGWRAVIGDEFTRENLQILAKAMAEKMRAELVGAEGIVIGYDRRFLAKEAMQWMAEVFAEEGIYTRLMANSCPTPLVMYYVQQKNMHYGMMVTASHNPALYNGVKIFTLGGRDADLSQTEDVERYIAAVRPPVKHMDYEDAVKKGMVEIIDPIDDYIDSILDDINTSAIRKANLHIALDPMYGVSEPALKTILITARCDVDTLHGNHDTLFGRQMPAPNPEAMRELSNYVIRNQCDMGIATDGDADRIGIIDDKGRYLSPNDVLVLLYWYLVKYRGMKGPCVRNLCTTHVLDQLAESFGEKCYEVPVGFKWISAKMDETHAIIGGESSGGRAIQGRIKGKDGIYAAALLTEMIAVTGKRISEIHDQIHAACGNPYMAEHNYRFSEELKEEFQKKILEDKLVPEFPFEVESVSYMDGCKVCFKGGGWVSVRFSGTEPLLRVFCEMKDQASAETVCNIYREFLDIE